MSVNLLNPKLLETPVIHRLAHDLESLCLVLIHIVRFSRGPIGINKGQVNQKTYRVSQWHHESDMQALEDYKKLDLKEIAEHPEVYVNSYWAPIAPFISQLIYLVYPGITTNDMDSTSLKHQEFKDVLIAARNYCSTLKEVPYNYCAFNCHGDTGRKHARPEDTAEIQLEHRSNRRRSSRLVQFTESNMDE